MHALKNTFISFTISRFSIKGFYYILHGHPFGDVVNALFMERLLDLFTFTPDGNVV